MPENTDEEHLDIPTNTDTKKSSDEIVLTNDTETINPNQESKNMEDIITQTYIINLRNGKNISWNF